MVKRLAWIYWGATVAFAVLFVLPFASVLSVDLGDSFYRPGLDYVAELFLKTRGWPVVALAPAAVLAAGAFVLLGVFLAGGVLSAAAGRGCAIPEFCAAGARYFWRLLRLLLLAAVCYALVLGGAIVAGQVGRRIWGEGLVERPVVIFGWVRLAVALALCLAIAMVFDYARIRLVLDDRRGAFGSLRAALGFAAAYPSRTLALYALLWAAAVGVAVIYGALSSVVPRASIGWLVLLILLQQGFLWARSAVKVLFLTKQADLYRSLQPPAEAAASAATAVDHLAPPERLGAGSQPATGC